MNNPTYPYKLAKLKDYNGDLSKVWHIEFYVYAEAIKDFPYIHELRKHHH